MTDHLTANSADVDAIIGLGDLVMATIEPAFDAAGVAPGSIPVVGWGGTGETAQAVKDGYVNAAIWGYPDASGYDSIVLLNKAANGLSIGYDVPTQTLVRRVHRGPLHRADLAVIPTGQVGGPPPLIETGTATRPGPCARVEWHVRRVDP